MPREVDRRAGWSRIPLLYRYVFREILVPFAVTVFLFTGILFLARILKLVDLVVNKNVPVADIVFLFLLLIPQFLEFAVPMALLIGIVLGFGRLSADSELTVLRATGISLRQLIYPIMVLALAALVLTSILGFSVRPWANYHLHRGLFEVAKLRASSGLVAGTFNDFGALTIYTERAERNGQDLKDIIIADRRDADRPRNFIARYGQMISDEHSQHLLVRLYDGSIHEGKGLNYNVTYFDINNIALDHSELMDDDATREGKRANEMLLGELRMARRTLAAKPRPLGKVDLLREARYEVEFHKRLALPFACPIIALIAMALGVQPPRTGKTWGMALNITVGVVSISAYYLLLAFATALGEQAILPGWFAIWLPNAIFGVVAVFFFRRMESEEWLAVSQAVSDGIIRLVRRLIPLRMEGPA